MLRPKIFPTLWKTWVVYGLPHGFARHDKILPIQPPNLKKKRLSSKTDFFQVPTLPCISTSTQPLAATRVAASGRKWPQVAAPASSRRVAASGRHAASGRKWPLSAISISTLKAAPVQDFQEISKG